MKDYRNAPEGDEDESGNQEGTARPGQGGSGSPPPRY